MSKWTDKKYGPDLIMDYTLNDINSVKNNMDYILKNIQKIQSKIKDSPELEKNKLLECWLDSIDEAIRVAGHLTFNLRPTTDQVLKEIEKLT